MIAASRVSATAAAAFVAAAIHAASAQTESSDVTVEARDVLPPVYFRTVHYEIGDEVTRTPFFYEFTVTSEFGTYRISSVAMLDIRLHEILTLAEVAPQLRGKDLSIDRAPGGQRGVGGDSVAEIISDPLGTAGTLIDNLRTNFEETFIDPFAAQVETVDEPIDAFEVDPGPHKRSAAAQIGVDVYSRNAELQRTLEVLADARSAGRLRQSIAPTQTLLVGPAPFGSGALDTRLRSKLKNLSAAEVNAEVDRRLEALGVDHGTRVGLLTHQSYSPRTRLYLSAYLGQLKAEDVHHLATAATDATTEADAVAFVNLARMAAFYRLSGHPLARVELRADFPLFVTARNEIVLALPIDHFSWTEANAAIVARLERVAGEIEADRVVILVSGHGDDESRHALATRGIAFNERYSF